jgi:hypothetical protein
MSKRRIDIPGKGVIQFEGAALPKGAKYFEAASFYSSLPEDIKRWVLDLRYAWGRERQSPSRLVLRFCDEIESAFTLTARLCLRTCAAFSTRPTRQRFVRSGSRRFR